MTTEEIYRGYSSGNTLEFTLNALADLGYCPALIFDDNGHWALSFTGLQDVSIGEKEKDISTTFFVSKKEWKKTVREAVLYRLKKLK